MDKSQTINAQIFQCLSYIADDSSYMEKALRALKRLTKQKMEQQSGLSIAKSEQDILNDIPAVSTQIKAAKNGKIKGLALEEFLNEV